MRMFPPKQSNTAESMPNSGGPINAKETYLKIHSRPLNRLLIRGFERKIKVATAKTALRSMTPDMERE